MKDECSATFSTIDHRGPLYKRSLVLFDRLVVPIPPHPVGDQTAQGLQQLAADTPLSNIVETRQKPAFMSSLRKLRNWPRTVLPVIQAERSKRAQIRAAMSDFDDAITKYREAIHEANFKKVEVGVCTVVAIGTAWAGFHLLALAAAAPKLFSLRELIRPSWKQVEDKDCSIAGVVYEAEKALR